MNVYLFFQPAVIYESGLETVWGFSQIYTVQACYLHAGRPHTHTHAVDTLSDMQVHIYIQLLSPPICWLLNNAIPGLVCTAM